MSSTTKGEWNPGTKYQTILSQIDGVLSSGEQRTVRDVYYALESHGHKWDYRFIKRAVKKGRRAGYIDPGKIIDASRTAEHTKSSGWENAEEFLDERVDEIAELPVEEIPAALDELAYRLNPSGRKPPTDTEDPVTGGDDR